ncbi:hypothetical protein [Pandoraea bronchicola]|uniref:Transmembrane protein n=1 Tax=Pandoraea bronchicola TaxID=2508287 RepID=A0A5E5BLF5_9BURK|nr:hypothetical protein [Pandoraea bronchicola]VVE86147.1 hypothetical protein PBR20603_00066 [Pandoraea bronchicola]
MRQESISGAGVQMPPHRAAVESAEDMQVNIDFPLTPDDVRLRSRTVNRLASAGCASGLLGLTVTVLGLAGLAGAAYVCLEADEQAETSIAGHDRRWLGYGFGAGLGFVSSVAVTFGLSQVGLSLRKRREAAQEMGTLNVRARFGTASTEDFRRERV